MTETIHCGGPPGCIDPRTPEEKIAQELKCKLADAEGKKIEAFFSVDIQRDVKGEAVPTVTIVIEEIGTKEQQEVFRNHLWGIADILRDVYGKKRCITHCQ
jgi:hypothetical protein